MISTEGTSNRHARPEHSQLDIEQRVRARRATVPELYARRELTERRGKDEAFRHAGWSPLPSTRQRSFEGLAHFQPDVSYRFTGLRLEPIAGDNGGLFEIQTSDARPRPAYRLGRLRFVVDGRELALTAYRVGLSRERRCHGAKGGLWSRPTVNIRSSVSAAAIGGRLQPKPWTG